MEVHHEIGVSFNQGGEIDDHDAVDHGHKRNNTVKVKVITLPKKDVDLNIIKRKVKMQSHFSPPWGGRKGFGALGIFHSLQKFAQS